jgi:uncharacterized protein YbjQ (UPF0145 family)
MANCAFCGAKLGLFDVQKVDGGEERLCMRCADIQFELNLAMKVEDREKLERHAAQLENIGRDNPEKSPHLTRLLQSVEDWRRGPIGPEALDGLLLTTGNLFEGWHITEYLGIITGETVLGTGMFSSWEASFADMAGERSTAFSDKLTRAKDQALEGLKRQCARRGGNAIIGVGFDYITFTNNMIGVVANGTAVKIEKVM